MFSPEGYHALTQGAGFVRRTDRGVLSVEGPDRLTWLQGLVTNDVEALPVGGVCDAAYLTPQGRMLTDLRVVNQADRTLLEVPASLAASLAARLDALLFAEDARIADISDRLRVVEVHGPLAHESTAGDARFLRDDRYGVAGYCAFLADADLGPLLESLRSRGVVAVSLETLDVVRVEAGRPAFLVDMDEHTIPLEAGIEDRAISFTKGCYVGQEVIIRVMHRGGGRVAKKLVGVRLNTTSDRWPSKGDVIVSGARDIGVLTSVVWSPALAAAIALGYVHRDFVEPGTAVAVRPTFGEFSGEISALPFLSRHNSQTRALAKE